MPLFFLVDKVNYLLGVIIVLNNFHLDVAFYCLSVNLRELPNHSLCLLLREVYYHRNNLRSSNAQRFGITSLYLVVYGLLWLDITQEPQIQEVKPEEIFFHAVIFLS